MNAAQFRKHGKEVIDAIADYYENLDNISPVPNVKSGYLYKLVPDEAPENPESFETVKADIETKIMPGMTHWQSGNFFAWYPSSSSFPSIIGDMYSSMFSIVGFSWISSLAATELETVVMDWLGKLLGLDKRFLAINEDGTENKGGGAIQTTASGAMVTMIATARDRFLESLTMQQAIGEDDVARLRPRFVAYFSDQTHSSGEKAANVIGCKARILPSNDDFSLTKEVLMAAVEQDKKSGLIPFFVCGTFGTTNTAAIDDIPGIADVAADNNMWLHIDAAYAGGALVCPEFRPLASGIERADSISINAHKWLLTNFDCSALWVADSTHLVNSMGIRREYLPRVKGDTSFVKDYRDWQIPLGRRFRALKLWFVMRMYGASGIRAHIREHVIQAKWLEERLLADGRFEIMAPVVFGLVVFRIKPTALSEHDRADKDVINKANIDLAELINNEGRVFILSTMLKGKVALRATIGAVHGSLKNVEVLLTVLQKHFAAAINHELVIKDANDNDSSLPCIPSFFTDV
ncbi:hypothetical protein COEREDRAFT_78881 [Coemansia reversa NRRL 1564]|uniref:Aromatic-L-amino-acid decarboxylase n=1 Tax=Coemansia reversa (strain ATCC 12441 / NRRL 1564) TaxID=763665 RepID=A0A2G5BLA5_COERN|nr:hypothetical protein COEREDRAFT_78881 [Coemansia reversa NRRL 1564]|eukprot:PIA19547.1 hypothetical protein COEREDRAFT_78881 [Coemansia reversa NRRL 1564]